MDEEQLVEVADKLMLRIQLKAQTALRQNKADESNKKDQHDTESN